MTRTGDGPGLSYGLAVHQALPFPLQPLVGSRGENLLRVPRVELLLFFEEPLIWLGSQFSFIQLFIFFPF